MCKEMFAEMLFCSWLMHVPDEAPKIYHLDQSLVHTSQLSELRQLKKRPIQIPILN